MTGNKDRILLTEMSYKEARKYFLKQESYFNNELPSYFKFNNYLKKAYESVEESMKYNRFGSHFNIKNAQTSENINNKIYANKDGKYDWRPLELINPYFYAQLVYYITQEKNWEYILERLENNSVENMIVASIPVESKKGGKDKKAQILNWWSRVEQESLILALQYKNVMHLDISNCYGSIYTHSIVWALHDREKAKQKRGVTDLLGNQIDRIICNMQNQQTNGIPQGSTLMDFVAEIVLSYCDKLLEDKLLEKGIKSDYKIIRYRDDYRIFSNSKSTIEMVTKELNDVLMSMNFKLNSKKTQYYEECVVSSIKKDKIAYQKLLPSIYYKIDGKLYFQFICQKHLLHILVFSKDYPNSGSVVRLLDEFNKYRSKDINDIKEDDKIQCISIITEIMLNNVRTIPLCIAIISKILLNVADEKSIEITDMIAAKFKDTPNVDLLNIWLQRLTISYDREKNYDTSLCQLVSRHKDEIFDCKWVKTKAYHFSDKKIVDEEEISNLSEVIGDAEVSVFTEYL
ncbi:RNA-directed DNA polymerase [Staphylococcus americanisciuri]|uniref:RNA-directed DNA polymerase n=1 Tax=Staphylococcus americanisciuri TaxID=2973940 RepID=A0ABT2F0D3_9STAP|nr:RNA-directed DNA polymerase [Staphylococcus americanisciuri]MCS4485898.1 RNA-directed DNA polymerase [Staphylococcus americanisciuri]